MSDPLSAAARQWAACDDVAELRRRGQAYEHAWVKATARELELTIEVRRLKAELSAMNGGIEWMKSTSTT